VLQAPANALFRFEDGWAVFVAQGGQAVRRKIEVGRRGAISVEVLSGLEVGEAVISSPGDMIEDGTSVDLQLQT
jgi:HlyD family secretion protein